MVSPCWNNFMVLHWVLKETATIEILDTHFKFGLPFQIWSPPPVYTIRQYWRGHQAINARMGAEQHTHKQPVTDVQTVGRSINFAPFLIQIPCYIQVLHLDATIRWKKTKWSHSRITKGLQTLSILWGFAWTLLFARCCNHRPQPFKPSVAILAPSGLYWNSIGFLLLFATNTLNADHTIASIVANYCQFWSGQHIIGQSTHHPPTHATLPNLKSLATRRQRSNLHDTNHVGRELGWNLSGRDLGWHKLKQSLSRHIHQWNS